VSFSLNLSRITLELGEDRVLVATLNRPEARNAIDHVLRRELRELLTEVSGAPEVGAIVLTGAGKAFCAGGDVGMMNDFRAADWRERARNLENGLETLRLLLSVHQPVIAAVNGAATGLGATIALSCDLIVMAERATLADTHVKVGIVAGDGGTVLWPNALGHAKAKQYLLTGKPMAAAEAERMGLVNEVVPSDELLARAREIAAELANGPRFAIEWTKQAINVGLIKQLYEQLPLSLAQEARTFEQPDMDEGLRAFAERRDPTWPSAATWKR
jgi:enoyl-CoA hydratase